MKRSISLASHNHKIINAISIHQETRAKRYYYRNRANLHSNKFHRHYLTSVSLSNPKYSTINSNCLLSINSWQSGPLIGDDYTLQVASLRPFGIGRKCTGRRRRWRRDKRSNVLFFGWPETLPYTNEAKLRVRRYPDPRVAGWWP